MAVSTTEVKRSSETQRLEAGVKLPEPSQSAIPLSDSEIKDKVEALIAKSKPHAEFEKIMRAIADSKVVSGSWNNGGDALAETFSKYLEIDLSNYAKPFPAWIYDYVQSIAEAMYLKRAFETFSRFLEVISRHLHKNPRLNSLSFSQIIEPLIETAGEWLLLFALQFGHADLAKRLLVEEDIMPTTKVPVDDASALRLCLQGIAADRIVEITKILIEKSANPNHKIDDTRTFFFHLVWQIYFRKLPVELLSILLNSGGNPLQFIKKASLNPLTAAFSNGSLEGGLGLEVAQLLLEYGCGLVKFQIPSTKYLYPGSSQESEVKDTIETLSRLVKPFIGSNVNNLHKFFNEAEIVIIGRNRQKPDEKYWIFSLKELELALEPDNQKYPNFYLENINAITQNVMQVQEFISKDVVGFFKKLIRKEQDRHNGTRELLHQYTPFSKTVISLVDEYANDGLTLRSEPKKL